MTVKMCTKKRATDSVSFAAENHNRYTIEAVYLYVFNFHSPWNKHCFMDSVTHCMKFPLYCTISANLTKPQTHKLWWCLVSGLHSVVETGQRLITPLRKGGWSKLPPSQRYFLSNDNRHRKRRRMTPTWSQFTGTPIIHRGVHTSL